MQQSRSLGSSKEVKLTLQGLKDEIMKYHTDLIQKCKDIQEHILDSEMNGTLDKSDSFYPLYKNLDEMISKLDEDSEVKDSEVVCDCGCQVNV